MAKQVPTVVITGASGFVGSYLVDYFSAKDWQVIGLVRDPSRQPQSKQRSRSKVHYVAYDLTAAPDELAFKNADYLIHLAYIKSDFKHPDALRQNIAGAKKLLVVSRKHKLKKNIFLSSMTSQADALSSYGQQKYRTEKLFNTNRDVAVRAGLIIGNGGLLKRTVTFMRSKHVAPLIGGGSQPLQVIAIYDLAQALEKLLASKLSGTLTIAHPKPYTFHSLYKTVAKTLDLRVLFIPVPYFIPQIILKTIKLLRLPFPVNEDNLLGLKRLRYFDTTKTLQRLDLSVDDLEVALSKTDLKVGQQ